MRTKRGGQQGPRTHTTRPHRQGTTTNMDTCPVLKRTHGSKDRTPHQSDTTYTLALIVDTCRFRACASTRTSEPCPYLGLDLWCRDTCVRFARLISPTASITFADSTFADSCFYTDQERTKSRLATIHILYNHKYHPIRG